MPSLRDRFFTPKVAHAIVSPSAIVATGAGAALGILVASGPFMPIAAIGLGALALAARVAFAIPRGGPRADRIDPFTLDEPWRRLTQDALDARRQFNDAVGRTASGPIQDRLRTIGETISAQIEDAWATARAGHELSRAYQRLDSRQATSELEQLRQQGSSSPTLQATEAALTAQLDAAQRMYATITGTHERLRLLNARLDEAVTRCIELSVGTFKPDQFAEIEDDLSGITHELEAVRQAVDATETAERFGTGNPTATIQSSAPSPGTGQPGGATG